MILRLWVLPLAIITIAWMIDGIINIIKEVMQQRKRDKQDANKGT